MSESDVIEALAEKTHDSWARYMAYFLSKCQRQRDGSLTIPQGYVRALRRQIETAYADLTEREKDADRQEVAHILPLIDAYAARVVLTSLASADVDTLRTA